MEIPFLRDSSLCPREVRDGYSYSQPDVNFEGLQRNVDKG